MNTKVIAVVAVILLAVGGYAAYARSRTSAPTAPATQTAADKQGEAAEFAQAIQSGRPTICSLAKGEDTMEYKLKGKMMRGNVKSTADGKTTLSHLINDGQYYYMWSDDETQGTKFSVVQASASPSSAEVTAPNLATEDDYTAMQDEGYTINCQAGSVTDADFVPPATVTFLDPSQMMKAYPSVNVPVNPGSGQMDIQKLQEQYGTPQGTGTEE